MKIYIIQYVRQLSNNYHPGGGIVIVASDIDAAKALVSVDKDIDITDEEWDTAVVFNCDATEPSYYVMENAGCC